MSKQPVCAIKVVRNSSNDHRGIGFLILESDGKVNADIGFETLIQNERRWMNVSFDWWIAHVENKTQRFHGWNKSQYKGKYQECFVFKAQDNRLYGFKCHPHPNDQRYEFCMLVAHATKHQWESEEGLLYICRSYSENLLVRRELGVVFKAIARGDQ
jgi:hypothetical protein